MDSKLIRAKILELCIEDYFGSWELWGSIHTLCLSKPESVQSDFIDSIKELVKEGKISAVNRAADGTFTPSNVDYDRLKTEIEHADEPNPNTYYWFASTGELKP